MAKILSVVNRVLFRAKHLPGLAERPHPHAITSDYVGPPDTQSNLRPVVRHSVDGFERTETDLAFELRTRRSEVEKWNHEFWANHNKRFIEEKEDFINDHKLHHTEAPTADEMSEFYKDFLDKNWRIHFLYNISWYSKNADMLLMAAQLKVQHLLAKRS